MPIFNCNNPNKTCFGRLGNFYKFFNNRTPIVENNSEEVRKMIREISSYNNEKKLFITASVEILEEGIDEEVKDLKVKKEHLNNIIPKNSSINEQIKIIDRKIEHWNQAKIRLGIIKEKTTEMLESELSKQKDIISREQLEPLDKYKTEFDRIESLANKNIYNCNIKPSETNDRFYFTNKGTILWQQIFLRNIMHKSMSEENLIEAEEGKVENLEPQYIVDLDNLFKRNKRRRKPTIGHSKSSIN